MKIHPEKNPKTGAMVFIATTEFDGMICTVLDVDDSGFSFKVEGTKDCRGRFENGEILHLTSHVSGRELIKKPMKIIGYHHINSNYREISQGITVLETRQFLEEIPGVARMKNSGVAGMQAESDQYEYGGVRSREAKEPEYGDETVNYLPEMVRSVFVKPASSQYDGTWQVNLRDADNETIVPLFIEVPDDSPVSSSAMAMAIGKVINRHLSCNQYSMEPGHRLPESEIEAEIETNMDLSP